MKKIVVSTFTRMLVFSLLLLVLGACKKNDFAYLLPDGTPVIDTFYQNSFVRYNEAQFFFNIQSGGETPITEIGICWSTSPNPTTSDNKSVIATNSTFFFFPSVAVSNLSPATSYYFRGYVQNSKGTTYSGSVSVTTPERVVAPCVSSSRYFTVGTSYANASNATGYNELLSSNQYRYLARNVSWFNDYMEIKFAEVPVTGKYITRTASTLATAKSCSVSSVLNGITYNSMAGDTLYVVQTGNNNYLMSLCSARMSRTGQTTVFRLTANISN